MKTEDKNFNSPANMPRSTQINGRLKRDEGTFTAEQTAAISARGKVMVSASAGAGKTTVMIKRLADILEEGADIDEVLCVTFTKKAAAQMKEKLRAELIKRLNLAAPSDRERLKKQLNKINSADISTIDSFCGRLVRTYFYVLGVESDFVVLGDDAEIAELKGNAIDSVFERLYAAEDEGFLELLDKFKRKRSDKNLRDIVSSSYDEVRINPDYRKTLQKCREETFTERGFINVSVKLKKEIDKKLSVLIRAIDDFREKRMPAGVAEGYFDLLSDMRKNISSYMAEKLPYTPPEKLTELKKPAGKTDFDGEYSAFINSIKKKFKSLTATDCEETERSRFLSSGRIAAEFIDLLLAFDDEYAEVKRSEGKLDYGDLEQYALKLLKEGDGDVKKNISDGYKFVFVDEYQDVNPIQDEIISLVSGGDSFCVGDVKQAIYGFRGSRSDFFSKKCRSVGKDGSYIILPDNFRSGGAVIDFVNELFSGIMTPPLCPVNYADGHKMRSERYPEGSRGEAQFVHFDCEKGEEISADDVYSVSRRKTAAKPLSPEAMAVLRLVEESLKSTYFDPDSGTDKPVTEGDICILTRKRSNKSAREIVRALSQKYSVAASAEVNICTRPEIIKLLDILSYLDNGRQDIPLTSALLSPLCGLAEDELALIRLCGGENKLFMDCVRQYADTHSDGISLKLKDFYARTQRLKKLSHFLGAAKLIDEILKQDAFAALFASEAGQTYLKTLKREAFAPSGELSLCAFLAKIKKGGYKMLAPASAATDCINVMTMHAAKGLEFPVVIVADISVGFKGRDVSDMPFSEEFGFAPRSYAADRSYSDTVLRRLLRRRTAAEELANEMNLFYVACTRAKYKLYVLTGKIAAYDAAEAAFAGDYSALVDFSKFDVRESGDLSCGKKEEEAAKEISADAKTLREIKALFHAEYKYETAVNLPVKSSASRLVSERDAALNALPLFDEEDTGGVSNPQVGLAYHRFLQLCDFSVKDVKGIRGEIDEFFAKKLISEEYKNLLGEEELAEILNMPVFDLVTGKTLYREREFLYRLPSHDYVALQQGRYGEKSPHPDDGNGVIAQGAIDLLCVKTEGGCVVSADIIDYKYSVHGAEYLRAKYSPQLSLYKNVAAGIYGLSPSAVTTSIVNIKTRRIVPLSL